MGEVWTFAGVGGEFGRAAERPPATALGHYPLLLVSGPGAEACNSIGIVLVAGMMIGLVFALFALFAEIKY